MSNKKGNFLQIAKISWISQNPEGFAGSTIFFSFMDLFVFLNFNKYSWIKLWIFHSIQCNWIVKMIMLFWIMEAIIKINNARSIRTNNFPHENWKFRRNNHNKIIIFPLTFPFVFLFFLLGGKKCTINFSISKEYYLGNEDIIFKNVIGSNSTHVIRGYTHTHI